MSREKQINLGYIPISSGGNGYYPSGEYDGNEQEIVFNEYDLNFVLIKDELIVIVYHSKGGFTRQRLIDIICETYRQIYREEDEGSIIKAQSIAEASGGTCLLMNRCTTNGKYGIWGHDIGDLILHTMYLKRRVSRLGLLILKDIKVERTQRTVPIFDLGVDS